MATNPTIKPKRGTIAPGPGSISQNELAVNTVSQSVYIGSVSGSGILVGSAPQGSSTQVQFNSSGVFAGSSNFTFDGSGVNVNGIVSSGLGISTSATTFNIVTNTASTINIGTTSGSTISIGNASGTTTIRNAGTNLNGTLTVTGVSVHQGAGSFNSTLSVTGEATFVGSVIANGGTITSSATTFNLLNTTVTNANVLGAANTVVIGGTGGTATIRNAGTNINGTLTVTGASTLQGAASLNSNLTVTGAATLQSTLAVGGNTISSASTTFNLLNTTVTNANVLGAANTVVIGGTGGTATIRNAGTNINGTLTVTGVSVHQGAGAFNSTLSVTGVTTLQGASTLQGAVNMNSTLTVTGVSVHQGAGAFNSTLSVTGTSTLIGDVTASGDIAVNGGDITSTATTFNLLNATVTNANVLGAANTVVIGGAGAGSTTIRNAATRVNGFLTVTSSATIQGALSTNSTLSVTGEATFVGSILANGGTITSTATTFNLLNTTVTNANVLGAAITLTIGGTSGIASIRNSTLRLGNTNNTIVTNNGTTNYLQISPYGNLTLAPTTTALGFGTATTLVVTNGQNATGQVQVNGGDLYLGTKFVDEFDPSPVNIIFEGRTDNANDTTLTVIDPTASRTISLPDASGVVAITTNGSLSVTGNATFAGSILANGGTITSSATTFNLLNTTVTNANVLGAANTVVIGGTGGTATVRNAGTNINGTLTVTGTSTFIGDVIVRSGDIETTSSVFSFVTNTASTINIGTISGSTISIGNASGTTTIGNASTNINGNLTVSGSSSFGAAVDHTFGLSNRGLKINAGKGTSEILSYGNETLAVSAMGGNGILELFGGNVTVGDDGNNDGTQIVLSDASGQTITYNASGGHIFYGAGSFDGLLTASAGISVSGATAAIFNGTVSCNSNTIYKPTLQYYNEVLASPTISANVLTLDLSTAQMFTVSLNANITTFTISNTPATANRSIGFTLIFTADGTARTVTWGAAVKWANNDPPALTSANGKKDILSFVSPDGGTNWYGFIGGLNF